MTPEKSTKIPPAIPIPPEQVPDVRNLWTREIAPTLRLAAPIMMARAGVTLMFVVDSIIVGHAHGQELAYLGQALAPQSVMMLLSIGILQGAMILSSQAYGAKDFAECGRVWKTALLIAIGLGLVFAVLSLAVEQFLVFTGTEPTLAKRAGLVSNQFAWGMPGMLLFIASNYFLETIKRPYYGMLIMAVCNVVNLAADGILVGGWFGLTSGAGAEMAVLTTSAVRWLAFILALGAIVGLGEGRPFAIYEKLGPVLPRMRRLLRLSGPIALMLGMDQAAFAAMSVMAGHMGVQTAAAQQLTTSLNGIFFMSIVGLAAATNIRVGHAVGAGDAAEAGRAGWSGIGIAAAITGAIAVMFLVLPETLGTIYTTDPDVLALAKWTIMAASVMLVFDGTLTVASAALRGRGDTMAPALIHMSALWLIGVPAAYALGFLANWGAPGLFLGLTIGMAISCLILIRRYAAQSQKGVKRA